MRASREESLAMCDDSRGENGAAWLGSVRPTRKIETGTFRFPFCLVYRCIASMYQFNIQLNKKIDKIFCLYWLQSESRPESERKVVANPNPFRIRLILFSEKLFVLCNESWFSLCEDCVYRLTTAMIVISSRLHMITARFGFDREKTWRSSLCKADFNVNPREKPGKVFRSKWNCDVFHLSTRLRNRFAKNKIQRTFLFITPFLEHVEQAAHRRRTIIHPNVKCGSQPFNPAHKTHAHTHALNIFYALLLLSLLLYRHRARTQASGLPSRPTPSWFTLIESSTPNHQLRKPGLASFPVYVIADPESVRTSFSLQRP